MNIPELCRRGLFDKITLNFVTEPIYGDDIELYNNMNFDQCTVNPSNSVDNSIFKIRLNILGVEYVVDKGSQVNKSEELIKDKKRGSTLFRVSKIGVKSYMIAYCDIIIVRDSTEEVQYSYTKFRNEYQSNVLIDFALQLQNSSRQSKMINNVAIMDKVYVYGQYRHCGVSSWLHNNVKQIVNQYLGVTIGDVILIPGDFTGEANKLHVQSSEYMTMLLTHYNRLGYQMTKQGIMIKPCSINSEIGSEVYSTATVEKKEPVGSLVRIAKSLFKKPNKEQ